VAKAANERGQKSGSHARGRGATTIQENVEARFERETLALFRTRLLTAAMFGALLSPLLCGIDVLSARSWWPELEPPPALLSFVMLRCAMTLWFVALWVFLRSANRLSVVAMDWLIFSPPAVALGYMTAVTGGESSPYIGGTILLVVARTILVPGEARTHLPMVTFLVLSYPASILVFGTYPGDIGDWIMDPTAMGYLAANLLPLLGIAGVGLVGSDMIHAMHQRLISARSLGRYKIKKELGRGAMGVVYLAWHRDLGRPCVIKVVNPEKDTSGSLRRRFEREARETSLLRSPYTVQVFDFGVTQQGQLFYVMEHLDGETLQDRLDREGPQPFDIVCRWLVSSAESLAEAHARMLIHRDVKPANIFLAMTADGREVTKVLDFGIATKVEANEDGASPAPKSNKFDGKIGKLPEDARLTAVGTIMGTPLYVAPEVLVGDHASDKADQYSLAATAFHLLTGRPVFTAETMEELLFKTIEDPAELPSAVQPDAQLPEGLDGVLLRALSKVPEERYESMEIFRQALEPFAAAPGASSSVLDLSK